jgi:hypothetical protein
MVACMSQKALSYGSRDIVEEIYLLHQIWAMIFRSRHVQPFFMQDGTFTIIPSSNWNIFGVNKSVGLQYFCGYVDVGQMIAYWRIAGFDSYEEHYSAKQL